MRNWKEYSSPSLSTMERERGFRMKEIYKQDPNFQYKVAKEEREYNSRTEFAVKVYKLLVQTIQSGEYSLLSCSCLEKSDPDGSPSKEFRFFFILENSEVVPNIPSE